MTVAWDEGQPGEWGLVSAAQRGSVAAFALLVERYHAPILRYLLHQTGDPDLAADLAQDTFVDAFRSLDRLTDDRSFRAWLHTIAHNNLRAAWRWRRFHRLVSLDWLQEQQAEWLQTAEETGGYAERDLIRQVFAELRPALREALVLFSVQGFSGEEVAQILGITPVAARQRISRAKEQFRARYAAHGGGQR